MQFTEAEIKWLCMSHEFPETRNGVRGFMRWKPLFDFRQLGGTNVNEVFQRVMVRRAVTLGRYWREYRETVKKLSRVTAPAQSLVSEIEAERLF